jgi:hypothetical protein
MAVRNCSACTDSTVPITETNKGAGFGVSGFNGGGGVGVVVDLNFATGDDDWFGDDDLFGDDEPTEAPTAPSTVDVGSGSGEMDSGGGSDRSCMGLLGASVTCRYVFGLSGNPNCCSCTERPDLDGTEGGTLKVGIESNCTFGAVTASGPANADEISGGLLVDTTAGAGCLSCCKFANGTIAVGGGAEEIVSTCVARVCDGQCKYLVPDIVNATDPWDDQAECSGDAAVTAIIVVFSALVLAVLAFSLYLACEGNHMDDDAVTKIDSVTPPEPAC